jgi:hypothetical protein
MNLNISSWGNFKISELFPVLQNGKANQGMLSDGYDCFYVGAKKDDNGVMLHCAYDSALIQKGNCIIFICNGQGSVGYANYMDVDFIGSTDIVAGYNKMLNQYNGLFIATVLCQERPKYSFGRKWKTHLKDTVIKLPQTIEGFPDWDFMEQYIKSLNHKPLTTQNRSSQHPLNINCWQEFKVGDYFDVYLSSGDLKIDACEPGKIPLVSSGATNNGIVGYIDEKGDGKAQIFKANSITVDMFCNAFYQNNDYYAVSHGRVNILYPKFKCNPLIGCFICSVINNERFKYSYGRAVYSDEISRMVIKLPTTSGNVPDFNFMENYIKSLPYGDRI